MNALAKSQFFWLLKREYWEERRGFLRAQIVVACVLVVLSTLGIIAAEVAGSRFSNHVQLGMSGSLTQALRDGLGHDTGALVMGLNAVMLSFGTFAAVVMSFVVFFYLLGALYDDRRDRSILFWKSLPISDTSTVIAKALAAIVLAPVIAVVVTLAGYLAQQVIVSIWFAAHGLNPFTLIWAHAAPFATWLHLVAMIPVDAVWALPTVGWLLLCSAAVRSKPFLWAVAVPVIAGVLNSWVALLGLPHVSLEFFWSDLVARALFSIVPASWLVVDNAPGLVSAMADSTGAIDSHIGTYGMMYHTFLTPQLWIGAAVGIAMIAAAIWFRRWRDET